MSAFYGIGSTLDSLHIASSYLYFIAAVEIGRDNDVKEIDVSVKKDQQAWLKSNSVEWCCPLTMPGARLPQAKFSGLEVEAQL